MDWIEIYVRVRVLFLYWGMIIIWDRRLFVFAKFTLVENDLLLLVIKDGSKSNVSNHNDTIIQNRFDLQNYCLLLLRQ